MRREIPRTLAQGQAGVYRVASELLLRGFAVNFPAVDCGADLTTDAGVRIQVKSAHLVPRNIGGVIVSAYFFRLGRKARVRNRRIDFVPRIFSQESEFVVMWGIEQNRFWIVPSPVLDGHQLAAIDLDEQWVKTDVGALIEARERGLSYREIAKLHGVTYKTVWRRLNLSATPKSGHGSFVQAIRETENRWDLISSHLAVIDGVEEEEHPVKSPESEMSE